MKRRKPLRRGKPLKRTPFKPKPHRLVRRTELQPRGRRYERDRKAGRRYGALADLVRAEGCQASAWTPVDCRGPVAACHARSRGAGYGDWIVEPGGENEGEVVGNLFGGCMACHDWSDNHKAESMMAMIACARENGRRAIEAGVHPVL